MHSEFNSAVEILEQRHGTTLHKTQLGLLKIKQATAKGMVTWLGHLLAIR